MMMNHLGNEDLEISVGCYHKPIPLHMCLVDGLIICSSLLLCSFLYWDSHWETDYWQVSLVGSSFFYIFSSLLNLYGHWRGEPLTREFSRLIASWLFSFFLMVVMASAFKTTANYSRVVFFSWALVAPILMCFWHRYLYEHPSLIPSKEKEKVKVVMAGVDEDALRVAGSIRDSGTSNLEFIGFYDDDVLKERDEMTELGFRHLGKLEDMEKDAQSGSFDLVYLNAKCYSNMDITQWVTRLSDSTASVYLLLDRKISPFSFEPHIHNFGRGRAISLYERPFKGWQVRVKRIEDMTLSFLILLLIAIPMLLIAIAIKLTSRGPVLFCQKRYGEGGRSFKMFKFRSMTVTEDGGHVQQAKRVDARVTPLGAFLRRRSLDEFPQFWNVFIGDMSIVGPRPHANAHNEIYRKKILGYMLRHKVKPGITGLAQISGCRGLTDTKEKMEKRVRYDLDYIKNWSLWLDLNTHFSPLTPAFLGNFRSTPTFGVCEYGII
jgi:putative colanic acid biosynthesis UDP-glucose lipid carrier transferase